MESSPWIEPEPQADRIGKALQETLAILHAHWRSLIGHESSLSPDPLDLRKRLILTEFREITTILDVIRASLDRLFRIGVHGDQTGGIWLQPEVALSHHPELALSHRRRTSSFEEGEWGYRVRQVDEIVQELSVHMKTLYEWLYHLFVLIRQDKRQDQIYALVPRELWSKLSGFAVFRSKLITHKEGVMLFLVNGVRYGKCNLELLMIPLVLPPEVVDRINELYERYAAAFPEAYIVPIVPGVASTRIAMLTRHLGSIEDAQDLREITRLIQRYGTDSVSAADVAEYVSQLAEALIPKLAHLGV